MSVINQWIQGIDGEYLIERLMLALAAALSISVHESSHGLAALWLGDDTAKRMGRISLNPIRHLDILGLAMMVLAGFGWAKPVPVDMRRFKNPKAGMALTALAGPVSNLLLAFLACPFYLMFMLAYVHTANRVFYWLMLFFYLLEMLNAGLAIFNLLPISPLDGSKVLAVVLPARWYAKLMRIERYGMILLMVLLFSGVLDKPLVFLRTGLMDGMAAVWGFLLAPLQMLLR